MNGYYKQANEPLINLPKQNERFAYGMAVGVYRFKSKDHLLLFSKKNSYPDDF
jgi:hypothetical protein